MHHVIILLLAYRDIICIVCFYPSVKNRGRGDTQKTVPVCPSENCGILHMVVDSTAAPVSAPGIKDVVVTCDFIYFF